MLQILVQLRLTVHVNCIPPVVQQAFLEPSFECHSVTAHVRVQQYEQVPIQLISKTVTDFESV